MIHLTSRELDDLNQCSHQLESVLRILDAMGAGIAAIHVNAAIEQLRKNIDAAAPERLVQAEDLLFPEGND